MDPQYLLVVKIYIGLNLEISGNKTKGLMRLAVSSQLVSPTWGVVEKNSLLPFLSSTFLSRSVYNYAQLCTVHIQTYIRDRKVEDAELEKKRVLLLNN